MESIGLDGAPSPRGQQDDTNARRREEGMRWLALARVKEAIKNMQLYCLNSIVKKMKITLVGSGATQNVRI